MRYLNGNNAHSDGLIERKEAKEINKELVDMGDRITELENEVHADEQALQDYKNETSITKQQGNFDAVYTKEAKADVLNAGTGNIDAVNAKTVNATDKVTTKDETVTGKATYTIQKRETVDEEMLLEILKRNGECEGIIKTKEYIDFDALENAIYHNRIPEDILAQMAEATEVREIPTLKVTKIKEKKG